MPLQHNDIRSLLSRIELKLDNGEVETDQEEQALLSLLDEHFRQEQQILYQASEKFFNDQHVTRILRKLQINV